MGGERAAVPKTGRPPDRTRPRTARGETATTYQHLTAAFLLLAVTPRATSLSEAPRLAPVYESILDAQFDRAEAQLATACPPAPLPACDALRAEAVWWQIVINPEAHALDSRLSALAANAITSNGKWVEREPMRAEAWFYLAGAYTPLMQLRVLRGERLSAARDGRKIKDALEHALELDSTLADAHLGIGLYHYYAAVAPLYARFLRWLLWLPGGDRVKGLKEIVTAREHSALLASEADFQLQQIYLWYENRWKDALALLESLDARYPHNPLFLERIADIEDVYGHDVDASITAWERVRDRAREHRVFDAAVVEARADQQLRQELARRGKK